MLDPDETLVVKLTGASTAGEATVNAATATTTIDDTGMVKVSVSAETVADDTTTLDVNEADDKSEVEEGEPASFVVELEKPVSSEVRVDYATGLLADSAKPGSNEDYAEATGTLTFTTGDTSRTIEVTTHDDGNNEGVEGVHGATDGGEPGTERSGSGHRQEQRDRERSGTTTRWRRR